MFLSLLVESMVLDENCPFGKMRSAHKNIYASLTFD